MASSNCYLFLLCIAGVLYFCYCYIIIYSRGCQVEDAGFWNSKIICFCYCVILLFFLKFRICIYFRKKQRVPQVYILIVVFILVLFQTQIITQPEPLSILSLYVRPHLTSLNPPLHTVRFFSPLAGIDVGRVRLRVSDGVTATPDVVQFYVATSALRTLTRHPYHIPLLSRFRSRVVRFG